MFRALEDFDDCTEPGFSLWALLNHEIAPIPINNPKTIEPISCLLGEICGAAAGRLSVVLLFSFGFSKLLVSIRSPSFYVIVSADLDVSLNDLVLMPPRCVSVERRAGALLN